MWNPLTHLREKILSQGGFVNAHAHFDRAYSISQSQFLGEKDNVNSHLHEKWKLIDDFKSRASEEDYFRHITAALRAQKSFGTKICMTFIDCDPVAGMRAIQASQRAKIYAAEALHMTCLTACQTLKGVLSPLAKEYFLKSLEFVDIIGGLPGADPGQEQAHLDVIFAAAKQSKKRVHVHVDQLNSDAECETETLAKKIMEWGLEGQVTAVHAISIAAHKLSYRKQVYQMCRDAGLSFVSCPTAWIDSRRNETLTPTHNALTPLDELFEHDLCVALGSDNICDLYKPYADGDMLVELRVLLEGTHFYNMDALVDVATKNGRKVLGL